MDHGMGCMQASKQASMVPWTHGAVSERTVDDSRRPAPPFRGGVPCRESRELRTLLAASDVEIWDCCFAVVAGYWRSTVARSLAATGRLGGDVARPVGGGRVGLISTTPPLASLADSI